MPEHDTLTVISENELVELETTIRTGKDAFIAVGNALIAIRDGRGYTLRNFKSFEDYCTKVWGFSDRHARRLMSGAEVAETVKQISGETPANEAVAREFAKVASNPKTVQQVVKKLQTRGGSVATATAEKVAQVVADVTGKNKPASDHGQEAKAAPAPKPAAPPPTFTDECPHCKQVPQSYVRFDGAWHCDNCDAAVFIGVVSANAKQQCPACKQDVENGAPYCINCGGAL